MANFYVHKSRHRAANYLGGFFFGFAGAFFFSEEGPCEAEEAAGLATSSTDVPIAADSRRPLDDTLSSANASHQISKTHLEYGATHVGKTHLEYRANTRW